MKCVCWITLKMELSGLGLVTVFSVILCVVYAQDYELTLNTEHSTVAVGAKPEYKCSIGENANFLITNPLKWERLGRDGSREIISVLANVEPGLESEFNVQLDTSDVGMAFTLSFLNGIKNEYDGHFRCVLYSKDNHVLAEKHVEVHVLKMFTGMEFDLEDRKQHNIGDPALEVRLEEGSYKMVCRTMGSNPAATVKIFLGATEIGGTETKIEDMDAQTPPQAWNVERKATITFTPANKDEILKCVAKVNNDDSMKGEIAYKLDIYTVEPEITCANVSAVEGDQFVDLKCKISLPGLNCGQDIFWENGENGEQFRMGTKEGTYNVLCSDSDGTVTTTFTMSKVTSKDFKTDYFIVYQNKHGSTKRVAATLNQDYRNTASSIQYALYLLCSTLLAVMLL